MTHIPTKITQSEVERLAGLGLPYKMISDFIGIDDKTLSKHYKLELGRGRAKAGAEMAQCLADKCRGGDTTALIFYAKTQLGWKETTVQETKSVSELSDDELDAKIAEKLAALNVGKD